MTKYTFSLKNNNNTTTFFTPSNKSTDYSKMLDDLIFSDIINKNEWLKTTKKNNNSTIILKDIDLSASLRFFYLFHLYNLSVL